MAKVCSYCKELKEDFYSKRNSWCKECMKLRDNFPATKEYKKKYRSRPGYRAKANLANREYMRRYPWLVSYKLAKARCGDPRQRSYKYYGGKGIEFKMSKEDFKFLWFRDKAYLLERPTIDRISNSKDYLLENCGYIEYRVNCGKRG